MMSIKGEVVAPVRVNGRLSSAGKRVTIGYTTEDFAKQYGKAIRNAKTRDELVARILPFEEAADDALKQARGLTDEEFKEFVRDLRKAKKEQPEAWIEKFNIRFGDIVMPYKMLWASIAADQFHCPWGCAFIRLSEMGFPPRNDTRLTTKESSPPNQTGEQTPTVS